MNKKGHEDNEKYNDLEIIIGDNSNLEFSEAKDCVNSLRPKDKKSMKNKVIVPKSNKK